MPDLLSQPLPVLALYVAINALLMLILGILVVRARVKTRTEIGDGGDPAMIGAMRAHGNNTEFVPMALLMMGVLFMLHADVLVLHALGGTLTIGRLLHAIGLSRNVGTSAPRLLGIVLTWISYLIGIVTLIWLTFQLPAAVS